MARFLLLIPLVLATSCTDFPELDSAVSSDARSAPYPQLVPMAGLLSAAHDTRLSEDTGRSLADRAARLRRKAAYLRRTDALSARDRARLLAAIERHHR